MTRSCDRCINKILPKNNVKISITETSVISSQKTHSSIGYTIEDLPPYDYSFEFKSELTHKLDLKAGKNDTNPNIWGSEAPLWGIHPCGTHTMLYFGNLLHSSRKIFSDFS